MAQRRSFKEQAERALLAGTEAALEACANSLDEACLETGRVEEGDLSDYLGVLASPSLRTSPHANALVLASERVWECLTEGQRSRVAQALERAFHTFDDWMASFVISELLGTHYADKRGLEIAERLRGDLEGRWRQFVPHLLEHMVTDTSDDQVRTRALAHLKEMETDASPAVRKEVAESLSRIARTENSAS